MSQDKVEISQQKEPDIFPRKSQDNFTEHTELLKKTGLISLDYNSPGNLSAAQIIVNDDQLLHKCNGDILSWLLKYDYKNNTSIHETALRKIILEGDNSLIRKVKQEILACMVRDHGLEVWNRIKDAKCDNFADGEHLCWAVGGLDSEAVALDIISDNEKVKKITKQQLLIEGFIEQQKVALALLSNATFMQEASSDTLGKIALAHECCAKNLYENIDKIKDFPNDLRKKLREKYPSFWKQNDRLLTEEPRNDVNVQDHESELKRKVESQSSSTGLQQPQDNELLKAIGEYKKDRLKHIGFFSKIFDPTRGEKRQIPILNYYKWQSLTH
jgi:hypothetical protein